MELFLHLTVCTHKKNVFKLMTLRKQDYTYAKLNCLKLSETIKLCALPQKKNELRLV